MRIRWKEVRIAALAVVLILAGGWASKAPSGTVDTRFGGTLRVGWHANPEAFDIMNTTLTQSTRILLHVFETLVTQDSKYKIIPMLADTFAISPDGSKYTFKLRQRVLFHNGKELSAADVVASLRRWGTLAGSPRALFKKVKRIESVGKYTVEIELNNPSAMLLPLLAGSENVAAIMPKEVVESIGERVDETKLIGTGPFRWSSYVPDRYVELVRFKDYVSRNEPPNGYGGRRTAYVDKIRFMIIPDASVRTAALLSGDVDYTWGVPAEQYDVLKANPQAEPFLIKPEAFVISYFNTARGPMSDPRVRRAVYMALDMKGIMQAAIGREEFYRLDHSLLWPETRWWTDVGKKAFNVQEVEKAKVLLSTAYGGKEIQILTAREFPAMFRSAQALKQQLEERLGMKVASLKIVDYATFKALRVNPDAYDIVHMYSSFDNPEPGELSILFPGERGFWANGNTRLAKLLTEWDSAPSYDAQYRKWVEIQQLMNEEVPWIKYGDFYGVSGLRKNVRGVDVNMSTTYFWNVWLERK